MRECPFCAEEIKEEAIKCKHCGSAMPEIQQKVEKEQIEAEAVVIEEMRQMDAAHAQKTINIGYGFLFIGFIVGIFLMIDSKLPWYTIPIVAYALWSLYWGVQIVHRTVKDFYDGLIIFGTGIVDLIIKQIGLRLGMYLLAIPIAGLIAGFLGGAIYKQLQFSSLSQKENKFGWVPIGLGIGSFIILIVMVVSQKHGPKISQANQQEKSEQVNKVYKKEDEKTHTGITTTPKEVYPAKNEFTSSRQSVSLPPPGPIPVAMETVRRPKSVGKTGSNLYN